MAVTGNLDLLLTSGFDAFTNLWDVTIQGPASGGVNLGAAGQDSISLRTSDFTPPKVSLKTYDIKYKGTYLERFSADLEYKDKRELNLTFRLDGTFNILKNLQAWKNIYYNASKNGDIRFGMYSGAIKDPNQVYGTITVSAYKTVNENAPYTLQDLVEPTNTSDDYVGAKWVFKQVALLDVDVEPFSRDDSKALLVKCMFVYGELFEPYTDGETGGTGSTLTPVSGGLSPASTAPASRGGVLGVLNRVPG